MDTISTGIGGALIGRALAQPRAGPAAALAVTAGAVLPDVDVFFDFFVRDPLATLTVHRGFTHSLLGVAVMALLLALLLRWFSKDKNYRRLLVLATLGLLWHLGTDLATSWGTMVFHPFSHQRVVWDLLFIIDFTFTAILLFPHLLAWTYRQREAAFRRGGLLGAALAAFAALVINLASRFLGTPFNWGLWLLLSSGVAAVLLTPAARGWGFRQPPASFCRIGLAVLGIYLGVCTAGHFLALGEVNEFIRARGLRVEALGALPQPFSPFSWSGLVLTPAGVYQSWFSLLEPTPPAFAFFPSDANDYIARAAALPKVETYLWFARFPVVRYRSESGRHIVEYTDRRFSAPRIRNPAFVFRVVFNARGELLSSGFIER